MRITLEIQMFRIILEKILNKEHLLLMIKLLFMLLIVLEKNIVLILKRA